MRSSVAVRAASAAISSSRMRGAIDFDNQLSFAAGDVGKIGTNGLLAHELEAPELAIA